MTEFVVNIFVLAACQSPEGEFLSLLNPSALALCHRRFCELEIPKSAVLCRFTDGLCCPEKNMIVSNFFGVRTARGASHLVVPEPPKPVVPPAAPKTVKRRKASNTTKTPKPQKTNVSAPVEATVAIPENQPARPPAAASLPDTAPMPECGFMSDEHMNNLVSYFDTEQV
ncbi:hypothetical protein [Rhodoferax ferrireducens]|uniref:hypothetical protein n=1 Tax=Rhodoferax ferrireducens TaxID=192843 RepID=UPI00140FDA52|nr:hypothetical protein [Rhodoferax ferrireducens]